LARYCLLPAAPSPTARPSPARRDGPELPAALPPPRGRRSVGQSFFFVGDLSHHSVLLIENPRMEFLYDTDAKQAVKTRLKMLSFLAENRIPILAYHFACLGTVTS
jgi:hypothetical protein